MQRVQSRTRRSRVVMRGCESLELNHHPPKRPIPQSSRLPAIIRTYRARDPLSAADELRGIEITADDAIRMMIATRIADPPDAVIAEVRSVFMERKGHRRPESRAVSASSHRHLYRSTPKTGEGGEQDYDRIVDESRDQEGPISRPIQPKPERRSRMAMRFQGRAETSDQSTRRKERTHLAPDVMISPMATGDVRAFAHRESGRPVRHREQATKLYHTAMMR